MARSRAPGLPDYHSQRSLANLREPRLTIPGQPRRRNHRALVPSRRFSAFWHRMLLLLCFLYCFFAIVLGSYLGLELRGVRRSDRMVRTLLKAAVQSARTEAAQIAPEAAAPVPAEPNYFKTR